MSIHPNAPSDDSICPYSSPSKRMWMNFDQVCLNTSFNLDGKDENFIGASKINVRSRKPRTPWKYATRVSQLQQRKAAISFTLHSPPQDCFHERQLVPLYVPLRMRASIVHERLKVHVLSDSLKCGARSSHVSSLRELEGDELKTSEPFCISKIHRCCQTVPL